MSRERLISSTYAGIEIFACTTIQLVSQAISSCDPTRIVVSGVLRLAMKVLLTVLLCFLKLRKTTFEFGAMA